mmetsp:Transcript_38846/g.47043  ORF Transcript_38846/g.47043 Transcript_38846/m.47043 type:complete len:222 (-) Transcript_38846:393-1058(-)
MCTSLSKYPCRNMDQCTLSFIKMERPQSTNTTIMPDLRNMVSYLPASIYHEGRDIETFLHVPMWTNHSTSIILIVFRNSSDLSKSYPCGHLHVDAHLLLVEQAADVHHLEDSTSNKKGSLSQRPDDHAVMAALHSETVGLLASLLVVVLFTQPCKVLLQVGQALFQGLNVLFHCAVVRDVVPNMCVIQHVCRNPALVVEAHGVVARLFSLDLELVLRLTLS